ncbi:hypothetical protein [Desulfoluna spongiiphila]|uniref:Uncharacterized protein n=1 Tax=Desulfoluna spongiiphila TaxID=419481 RepID=A0A1G5FYL2_9BACT|nr:hypothetical protein [Desulfoluna spongiiphila]SCY43658.1 hypothetical protein SAMN05216233_10947 [Desulfoluna spongiiphila]
MNIRLTLFIAAIVCLHTSTAFGIWNYERPADSTPALMGCWSDGTTSYAVGFNGAAFCHEGGTWKDISDDTLADAALFAVHGTASGDVYASGFRFGAPRFDSDNDGQINADDDSSRYGVIFRYNGSGWEELNTLFGPESQFFASSFTGLWTDENGVVYVAGGKKRSFYDNSPVGILLAYDGASFSPLVGASYQWPNMNTIWGSESSAYVSCAAGLVVKVDTHSRVATPLKTAGSGVNFRGVWKKPGGTLYAVAEATYGYILRYDETDGWQDMAIDKDERPPLLCIAGNDELLVAAGEYGKAYYLDTDVNIWKEMLTGTQNHINGLSVPTDGFLAATYLATDSTTTPTGALYRMTEKDPNTAYILADQPTGISADDPPSHEVILYDFALGDIWKREWVFNNGINAPVPSYGILYSSTPEGANTALEITGEGGEESNRELRIYPCSGCTPHVDVSEDVIRVTIRSGITTQNQIKTLLEESHAVSYVYPRHGTSPWVVSTKGFDSALLKGGRNDEDIYINEETSGDTYYLAVHRFKGYGTWEPKLTVYRENVAYLNGMIKIIGHRTTGTGTTVEIIDAGDDPASESAKGLLGGLIDITAPPGEKGNIEIKLISPSSTDEVTSTLSPLGNKLSVHIRNGITTIQAIIDHLNTLNDTIASASFKADSSLTEDSAAPWMEIYGSTVTLEGGTNHAVWAYNEDSNTVTLTMDSGITTTTDIAKALSDVKTDPEDNETRVFRKVKDLIPYTTWDTEKFTNTVTLTGIATEPAKTTVRVFNEDVLDFNHTPNEAKLSATVTFTDQSEAVLDIIRWQWDVFRPLDEGYETKASVTTETGTAEVTISDLGTYNIGLRATLKDGSTLTMVKDDALKITGKHAGDSSLDGANGCFIGAVSPW